MNAKLDLSPHDSAVLSVANRLHSIGTAIAKTVEMHHEDQADRLGQLIDELRLEQMRLVSAREFAYELAGTVL